MSPDDRGELTPAAPSTTAPAPATAPATAESAAASSSSGTSAAAEVGNQEVLTGRGLAPNLSTFDPEIIRFIQDHPELMKSVQFRDEFVPQTDINYAWLLEYAEEQFEQSAKIYAEQDAKAASIITHIASGTGLLTLGTVAALASGGMSPWVALASLVPFSFSLASLLCAVAARRPVATAWAPSIRELTRHEEQSKSGPSLLLGYLDLGNEMLVRHADRRGKDINSALWLFITAVGTLIIPLVVAIAMKLN